MKILYLKIAVIFFFLVSTSAKTYCQLSTFIRGHTTDDMYVYCYSEVSGTPMLLYLSTDGYLVHKQNEQWLYAGGLTAEPGPGIIIGHNDQFFGESIDYGKLFYVLAPFVNDYTSIIGLYGGEVPGEYIIQGDDPSVWPYPMNVIYKTSDYFAHYALIADTSNGIIHGEIGLVSGELFQMPIINKHACLTHSLDYGATSDTISVDTAIINENTGLLFKALSRGTVPGELFLVTQQTIAASEIKYFIYHSADYGASWQLKSTKVFDSDRQQFTAGRSTCKFYIANLQSVSGSTYYKLQILFSSDCGETFSTYEHLLTPDVGLKEDVMEGLNKVNISPNPASQMISISYQIAKPAEIEIEIYNSLGKCVFHTVPSWEASSFEKSINIENLKQGFYSVQLQSGGSTNATGKFIISR